jgi:nicotinamidase-related amidase
LAETHHPRRMKPTPGRTALIVIDMQNAFCRDDGSTAKIGLDHTRLKAVIGPCAALLAGARDRGLPVVFTRYAYRPDYADGGILVRYLNPALGHADYLATGSADIEIVSELAPLPGEPVIDKNRPSAFYSPAFEETLRALDVDSLVVCGVTTNCCVESTVRDASQKDYKVFVVTDAVGELEEYRHHAGLAAMRFLFADLVTGAGILAELAGS